MHPADRDDIERNSLGILDPGRMREHVQFRRIEPDGDLCDLVEWFWAVRWSLPEGEEFVQPVLAHPTANLSVGPASSRGIDRDDIEATAVGVTTSVDRRRLRGDGWNVAAKLRPGGLGAVLSTSATELTDRIVPLADVVPIDVGRLVSMMVARAGDVDAQVAELATALRSALQDVDPQRLQASRSAVDLGSMVEHDRAIRSVRALAGRSGFGVRSLQRLFAEHAGVSPLWMIRRYRLIEAADAARGGRPPSWSALAAVLGYADQAHLARDFKSTVGMTPSEYAASVRPLESPRDADREQAV